MKEKRTIGTEYEVLKQTDVSLMYDREATSSSALAIFVAGVEIESFNFKPNSTGEVRLYNFVVPAGKKWKVTTTESEGKLTSTYLQ